MFYLEKARDSLFCFLVDNKLFSAVLGLCCCSDSSLVDVSRGYYLAAVADLSLWWLPLFQSTGSGHMDLSSCGCWTLEHRLNSCGVGGTQSVHNMWNLPRSGIEPLSSALEHKFFTTEPPGKPNNIYITKQNLLSSDI